MLPLREPIRPRRRPWVTIALIVINTVIFVVSLGHGQTTLEGYSDERTVPINGFDRITLEYGFTPCELGSDCERPDRGEVYQAGTSELQYVRVHEQSGSGSTLVTAMFMHGSWLHLIGNMLFLWVFGNAVEDAMPRLAYLLFYLACGFAADLTQWAFDTASSVPNIGASGAISGVLGGYFVLYPRARVLTGIPLAPLFLYLAEIPAVHRPADVLRAAAAGGRRSARRAGAVVRHRVLRAHRRLRGRPPAGAADGDALATAQTQRAGARRGRPVRPWRRRRTRRPSTRCALPRSGPIGGSSLPSSAPGHRLDVEQPGDQVAATR